MLPYYCQFLASVPKQLIDCTFLVLEELPGVLVMPINDQRAANGPISSEQSRKTVNMDDHAQIRAASKSDIGWPESPLQAGALTDFYAQIGIRIFHMC